MSVACVDTLACMDHMGLSCAHLDRWLGMLEAGDGRGDLFFQHGWCEELTMEQGRITGGRHAIGSGVAVGTSRRAHGSRFASSSSLAIRDVDAACNIVASSADHQGTSPSPLGQTRAERETRQVDIERRMDMLRELHEYARKADVVITQLAMSLAGACEDILVVDTAGLMAADRRPQAQFRCKVTVQHDGRLGRGSAGTGGRTTYDALYGAGRMREAMDAAIRMATAQMVAQAAPHGRIPVVFAPGWNGMLLHETVGHLLEADSMQAGTSTFAGKIGQQVAPDWVDVFDDGTLPGLWGTSGIDDEGQATGKVCLVERGVLSAVLHDRSTASFDGVRPTGNARRQSYAQRPMPRMTNTYLGPGTHRPSEIVSSVDRGIYARALGGGQVHPVTGRFVFEVVEAYLIERGEIGTPLKSFFVSGTVTDFLLGIAMVGNDLAMDPGVGRCVKRGQTITVGVGQPTIRVDGLKIAGAR